MKKTKVYVAIPTVGSVADVIPYAFRGFEQKYGEQIEFVYPEHCVQRKMHDFARNAHVTDFLASDCDILWFLDSDVVPPPHVLDLITEHGDHWDLAGAPYPVFMSVPGRVGPQIVMCVYERDAHGFHSTDVPQEGRKVVAGLATGCLFIKRAVLEKMEAPYFEFKYDATDRRIVEGEDLNFCAKVNDLGYKFFTDFSMVCGHYKQVNLLDVNNYAIQYANASVMQYDAQIRPTIEALASRVRSGAVQKPKSALVLPDRYK